MQIRGSGLFKRYLEEEMQEKIEVEKEEEEEEKRGGRKGKEIQQLNLLL